MPLDLPPWPLNAADVLDRYFLEVRADLLHIAATLDRVYRAPAAQSAPDGSAATALVDARLQFIQKSLAVLASNSTHKAKDILELYSLP